MVALNEQKQGIQVGVLGVVHDKMKECGAIDFAEKVPDGKHLQSIKVPKVHRGEEITVMTYFSNTQFLHVDCER